MAEFFTVQKIRSFTRKLDNSSVNIVPIYQNRRNTGRIDMVKNEVISVNAFVKNLKAFARITSLGEANIPSFNLEDSETEKLRKTLEIEWGSERKQLDLYITENGKQWEEIGSISLINPSGYPYRLYQLQDLYTENLAIELGENGGIGVAVKDVGFGKLIGDDIVTIHGSVTEELVITERADYNVLKNCRGLDLMVSETSSILLPEEKRRKYLLLTNNSEQPIFISLSGLAELNNGVLLSGYGSSFELSVDTRIYTGVVTAIAASPGARITGKVCY